MGRPKKSTAVKQAQGTLRPSREIVTLDLAPLKDMPATPPDFNADEAWFFNTTCEALFHSNLLRSADLMTIRSMAGWWSIMIEAQKDIRENGMIQVANSGYKVMSPSVSIFEKAWNKLKDFSDRYGFNLVSKDKISAPPKKDEKAEKLKMMAQ